MCDALPGSASLRCFSASTCEGVSFDMATVTLFFSPATTFGLALEHGLESDVRHVCRVHLVFRGSHLGVQHTGALEEFSVGDSWHQTGQRDRRVLQLIAQRGDEESMKALVPL